MRMVFLWLVCLVIFVLAFLCGLEAIADYLIGRGVERLAVGEINNQKRSPITNHNR